MNLKMCNVLIVHDAAMITIVETDPLMHRLLITDYAMYC